MASLEVMKNASVTGFRSRNGELEYDGKETPEESLSDNQSVKTLTEDLDFPEGGRRAWCAAAGAAGVMFSTLGYINAFGVLQEYYGKNQLHNQTESQISWIGSLQIFFLFSGGLFGGPLFDRFGSIVVWPPAALYVFSIVMTSISKSYHQFVLSQGVLAGLTAGLVMSPSMAATGQYFHKNRGAALGFAVAGSSLGGVIFPIALGKMLYSPRLSFGWTIRICGFIDLTVLTLSCALIRARLPPRKGQFLILSAFKERLYVAIICASFLMMLGFFIPFFYIPTFAVAHGMSTKLADYQSSILNGASLVGRIVPGILADRLGRLNMFFAAGLSTGILVLVWVKCTTNASIITFSVLYGFFSGAIISLMSLCLASSTKDPRNIGTYMGMGMCVVSFAALIGPPVNGALATHYHGFTQLSIFSGLLVLAGACVVLLAKRASGKGVFGKI